MRNFFIKYASSNPFGICLAIINWAVAFIAVCFLQVDHYEKIQFGSETAMLVLAMLFILNLPAIIPTALFLLPIYFFGENYFVLLALFGFFTITFQWLFVGKKIHNYFWRLEPAIQSLEINNLSDEMRL